MINEILCNFYKTTLKTCKEKIRKMEATNAGTISRSTSTEAGGSSSSSSDCGAVMADASATPSKTAKRTSNMNSSSKKKSARNSSLTSHEEKKSLDYIDCDAAGSGASGCPRTRDDERVEDGAGGHSSDVIKVIDKSHSPNKNHEEEDGSLSDMNNSGTEDADPLSTTASKPSNKANNTSNAKDPYHYYRVKATAEYTLVNLQDIMDYGMPTQCAGGTPKWLVVEYHDKKGNVSYHRKVIRYKLYERKSRYVDTVAAEFDFPDPNRSELFVVYTDARKTSYRVNYGHDMLRPDEELKYDLDWTDCYFIYKAQDTPLRDNLGKVIKIPEDNGQVFFLCELPNFQEASKSPGKESSALERSASKSSTRKQSRVQGRKSGFHSRASSTSGPQNGEQLKCAFTEEKIANPSDIQIGGLVAGATSSETNDEMNNSANSRTNTEYQAAAPGISIDISDDRENIINIPIEDVADLARASSDVSQKSSPSSMKKTSANNASASSSVKKKKGSRPKNSASKRKSAATVQSTTEDFGDSELFATPTGAGIANLQIDSDDESGVVLYKGNRLH